MDTGQRPWEGNCTLQDAWFFVGPKKYPPIHQPLVRGGGYPTCFKERWGGVVDGGNVEKMGEWIFC